MLKYNFAKGGSESQLRVKACFLITFVIHVEIQFLPKSVRFFPLLSTGME